MKINQIKFFAIAIISLPLIAGSVFYSNQTFAVARFKTDAAETYKTKCAMCHKAGAEKFYNPEMSETEQVEAILKGKKAEKPPHMPAYESKGIDEEQARALVVFMKKLRNPDGADSADGTGDSPKEEAIEETKEKAREAVVALYKSKCAMCHKADAEKFYNTETDLDEQVTIILEGKKMEKPPHMPGYKSKGVTEKEAKALAVYMRELRTPEE
jgi:mono/diheme cytochrome c family protein